MTATTNIKTLTHKQRIRTGMDQGQENIRVYTVEGDAIDNNEDPKTAVEKAISFKKNNPYTESCLVWTHKAGAVICADYPGKDEDHRKDALEYAASDFVANGEHVRIENRIYKARYMRKGVCDPVHFDPVS